MAMKLVNKIEAGEVREGMTGYVLCRHFASLRDRHNTASAPTARRRPAPLGAGNKIKLGDT